MKPLSVTHVPRALLLWSLTAMLFLAAIASASAQAAIRFSFVQVRDTVPVNFTNSTTLTGGLIIGTLATNNTISLLSGATNVNLSLSGLPPQAQGLITDTNGNPLTVINNSTAVWVTVNATNVPEGIYNFTLTAIGFDVTNLVYITNTMPFVLQSAYIWAGSGPGYAGFGTSNDWAQATNWLGGAPGAADDVVFSDSGAQTNTLSIATGITPNDVGIDAGATITVGSIRFSQNTFINTNPVNGTTNGLFHTLKLGNNATLNVTGTNGFSLLRDYINDFGVSPDNTMGVNIVGLTNSILNINNSSALFAIDLGNLEQPTLNFSNLAILKVNVSRMGIGDYELYPNYRALNVAYNGGHDSNSYSGYPRRMIANVFLARTNYITANYVDPNNYTNEFTRGYGLTVQNNEQSGNGSSTSTFFFLGQSNQINADGVCFIGSSSASGNNGGTKFNLFGKVYTNSVVFRNADGVSRMSMFCVADDGGTNEAASNVKATLDLSGGLNYCDLLADRFYVARDRTLIASNQTPNVQGTVTFGNCKVNVNSMILGFQEHSNKIDWTTIGGAQPYLNYCRGQLTVTNNGNIPSTFVVNGNANLGYTADRNPVASAQQYNTYGQITLYTNVTMLVSNLIVDGGLNYLDGNGRQNNITINRGAVLEVTNTLGSSIEGASDFSEASPLGMKLDNLTISAGTLGLFLNPANPSAYVRALSTPGIIPGVIKVLGLTGVSSFPVQIPAISYEGNASPFLTADVSALGVGYYGYVINNPGNQSVDVYITTNPPDNIVWTGNVNNSWDTTTKNWVTAVGGFTTNFNLGDIVTFNDSTTVTNVSISGSVVPGQTGVGVTITNTLYQYDFSGGTIAGTALVSKSGTNLLDFEASEQGPINITSGALVGFNTGGQLGALTVSTNVPVTYAGTVNGGLTSSGQVTLSGTLNGPITLLGGYLVNNNGTMNILTGANGTTFISMTNSAVITNLSSGTMNIGSGPGNANTLWDLVPGSVLANFGTINLYNPKLSVEGLLFGTGQIYDPNGGGFESIANTAAARIALNGSGVLSPGATPVGSIASMEIGARFDFDADAKGAQTPIPGISTVRIEFDFTNPQTNDVLNCDRWNNDTGFLLLTNINPTHGTFTNGTTYTIFHNTSGQPYNYIDTLGYVPNVEPYTPGPGMVWGIGGFSPYGYISVTNSGQVWDGATSSNWSTNGTDTNWKTLQTNIDNSGAVFNDTAVGPNTTVTIVGNVAPSGYPVTSNVVVGVSTNFFTNYPNFYPGIVVSNANLQYAFQGAGKITGPTGLYKTGPGTLTLLTSNDFVGNVIVDNGVLAVSNNPGVYNANITSLGVVGSGQLFNDLILDGGTLSYIGSTNQQLSEYPIIQPNGGTINIASNYTTLSISTKVASGPGTLTKTGPGNLLMNVPSTYTGGTVVNSGTLTLAAANPAGFGPITLNNTVTLQVTNFIILTNMINVAGPAVSLFESGTMLSTNITLGPITGSGTLTVTVTNLCVLNGDESGFSGTLSLGSSTGVFQFNNSTNKPPNTGSASASYNLGTGTAVLDNYGGSNLTYNLGSLAGGPNTLVAGAVTNLYLNAVPTSTTTYSIGANGTSTTFSGVISNGYDTVNVVKVGSGGLLLNGNSTYTGTTAVNAGSLGGTGSIASPLTIGASGTLTPGAPVGTFTVSNNATLGGSVLMQLNTSLPATNSQLAVIPGKTLTVGGTLVVTNVGPNIVNGTTFKLFNQSVTGFSQITLPLKDPSNVNTYGWTTNLSVNGSITLVSGGAAGVNTNSTNIIIQLSGTTLSLTWPGDHLGWRLLAQTNTTGTGLGTNWVTVAGSTSVTNELFTVNPANGCVFYRLVYP